MNEKLKGILRTAWNEPRHFFFWLTMLSILGFVVVVSSTSLGLPNLLGAFLALGCVLCFVISLPAFVLAWIPLVRRLFSWLLGRRFVVLACLVTLVALFYAEEDWRGRRAWQDYQRKWEAKGERFDQASFIPPPVPTNENFFETPLWSDMHFFETNGVTVWSDTNWAARVIFDIYGPNSARAPSPGDWREEQPVDLAAWQSFYEGNNNLFAAHSGPATNYFPVAQKPQSPAADVLLALSRFKENRQLLIAAAARPQARFWINYDAGFAALLPHLARVKSCAVYLSLHATAALKAGDRDTALEDTKLLFRLTETIRGEPFLISQLVRIAMLQRALQPVWEGLADRQWTAADLSVIESELGKLDFLADYEFAVRGERTCCELWAVDYVRKAGIDGLEELVSSGGESSESAELEKFLGLAMLQLIPTGWFDQNKLSICRLHELYWLPVVNLQERVVSPAAVQKAQAALQVAFERRPMVRPYDMFSTFLVPSLGGAAKKFAYAQTSADLAHVACALEEYRLANGTFPETLEALAPKFLEKLPHDVINGQPLRYRRADDGQFILYSVGWNQTDDGGTVGLNKSGNLDLNEGDWVWRYPNRRIKAVFRPQREPSPAKGKNHPRDHSRQSRGGAQFTL